jgi:hypothetical protein
MTRWTAALSCALAACGSTINGGGTAGGGPSPKDASAEDTLAAFCAPGRSIACVGAGDCSAFQVCNNAGTAYGPCDCPDAAPDTGKPPSGELASFELLVNGVEQVPLHCPDSPWDYAEPAQEHPDVVIKNTGPVPIAYNALASWSVAPPNIPGVSDGESGQLVGVLAPAKQVDITSVFTATMANEGGAIAVLGSAAPFSMPLRTLVDEGTVPWPSCVGGSGGAATMYVVQLTDTANCQQAEKIGQYW